MRIEAAGQAPTKIVAGDDPAATPRELKLRVALPSNETNLGQELLYSVGTRIFEEFALCPLFENLAKGHLAQVEIKDLRLTTAPLSP
jgi:hypothetical protein